MRSCWALFTVIFATSCQKDDEPPPFIGGDCHVKCSPGVTVGRNLQPEGGPGSGDETAGDAGSKTLTGTVSTLSDASFQARTQYVSSGSVAALGASGAAVATNFDGPAFTLPGAETSRTLWIATTPATGVPDVMQTLMAVNGTDQSVFVNVVRQSVMADILTLVTGATQQALRSDRAQVVLTFVDANGLPVSDVTIVRHEAAAVLYDFGDSYLDAGGGATTTSGATSARGTAVLVNESVPVGSISKQFPGNRVTTIIASRPVTGQFPVGDVIAAKAAVTFRSFVVPQ